MCVFGTCNELCTCVCLEHVMSCVHVCVWNSHRPTGRSVWQRSTEAFDSFCFQQLVIVHVTNLAWLYSHGGPSSTQASYHGYSDAQTVHTPQRVKLWQQLELPDEERKKVRKMKKEKDRNRNHLVQGAGLDTE